MRHLPEVTFGFFLLAMLAVSPGTAAASTTTPTVVYVSDFELKAAHVQQSVPKPVPRSERVGYGRPKLPLTPERRARELVGLMSRSLLADLRQAGIQARRLLPGAPLPSSGWLIRGAFLQLYADGGLRRAVLGAGSAQLELVAAIDQLSADAPQPLYTIDSAAQVGTQADAVVTLNPNMALGRFMLAGLDLDRNVRDTAEDIADQVKMRIGAEPSGQSETR